MTIEESLLLLTQYIFDHTAHMNGTKLQQKNSTTNRIIILKHRESIDAIQFSHYEYQYYSIAIKAKIIL